MLQLQAVSAWYLVPQILLNNKVFSSSTLSPTLKYYIIVYACKRPLEEGLFESAQRITILLP